MGFFLPMIAAAFVNKTMSPQQPQQQQPLDFKLGPERPQMAPIPNRVQLRGANPKLIENPILAAYQDSAAPEAEEPKKDAEKFNFKEQLMSSLIQNAVQRMIFGGQQQAPQYSPPTFGR